MYQQIEFQCFEKRIRSNTSRKSTLVGCLLFFFLTTNITFAADKQLFSTEDVVKFSPRANKDFVKVLVDNQELMDDVGINTKLHIAHFFAQIATETGGMRRLDEDLNYSKEVLLKVFSRKTISVEKANQIARKPIEIANWVYGGRLGNRGKHTNDGWNYRGSGFIQLTGRTNFKDRGDEVKLPLESNPELVRQPLEGLKAASSYWKTRKINNAVAKNNIYEVRKLVNGPAAHGLPQAKIWFSKASKVFGVKSGGSQEDIILAEAAKDSESLSATAQALHELGFLTQQESSEGNEQAVSNGLRAYQKNRGLKETGILDEDTLYSITDPQEWRGDPEEEVTQIAPNPIGNPEASYIFDVDKGTETEFDLMKQTPSKPTATISRGTGSVNPNKDFDLSEQEASLLDKSITTYAPYELAEGRKNEKGTFLPFSVIGKDEREVVTDTSVFPSRAIVQILFTSSSDGLTRVCTGSLISPNTVLTAGHCVHSGTANGSWYTKYTVYPGRNTGSKPFGSCTANKLYTLNGWRQAENYHNARLFDLGAIKLNCDIGQRTGWFNVKAIDNSGINSSTTIQGYPADKPPAGRQWKSIDKIRVLQDLNVFYQNDTFGGMSGSPVFNEKENTIFAIHTSGLHGDEPWKSNNGATKITPERLQTIMYWGQN